MEANHEGGFTLEGDEIKAAQWATEMYKPASVDLVNQERHVWDNEQSEYRLPLGPGECAAVFDALEIAYALKKCMPPVHRWPIRRALIQVGRRDSTVGDKLRFAVVSLAELLYGDD